MELPSDNYKSDIHFWPRFGFNSNSPAIMESIDSPSLIVSNRVGQYNVFLDSENQKLISQPDVTLTSGFTSLKLAPTNDNGNSPSSFLLLDGNEHLKVSVK